jgi:predicted Zn-dependent protease
MRRLAPMILAITLSAFAHEGLHEQIETATAMIKRDPTNAALYLQRGELYRLHQDWTAATRDYDRASHLDPSMKAVDAARGRMLYEAGKPGSAQPYLDRYLASQPDDGAAHLVRARVLVALGKTAMAVEDFDAAVRLDVDGSPDLYCERARAIARTNVQLAIQGLDEGMTRLGIVSSLQRTAIELELQRRSFDEALRRLDTLAAQSDRKERFLVEKASILERAGRKEEARAAYEEARAAIALLTSSQRASQAITGLEMEIEVGLDHDLHR